MALSEYAAALVNDWEAVEVIRLPSVISKRLAVRVKVSAVPVRVSVIEIRSGIDWKSEAAVSISSRSAVIAVLVVPQVS